MALALLFVVAGCGAAGVQPAAEPPTSNLDELEHRLDKQEAVIQARLGPTQPQGSPSSDLLQQQAPVNAGGAMGGAGARPSAPRAAPPPPVVQSEKDESAPEPEAPAAKGASAESTCGLVCRALASMRRSADRICEIVGKEDPRCAKARGRVDDATRRVVGAGCECGG